MHAVLLVIAALLGFAAPWLCVLLARHVHRRFYPDLRVPENLAGVSFGIGVLAIVIATIFIGLNDVVYSMLSGTVASIVAAVAILWSNYARPTNAPKED